MGCLMRNSFTLLAIFVLSGGLSSKSFFTLGQEIDDNGQATSIDVDCRDIADVIDELSRVGVAKTFQRAYKSQGYDVFLSRLSPPFTVLVPSDQAWRELADSYPGLSLEDILSDDYFVQRVLAFHIISKSATRAQLQSLGEAFPTLDGDSDITVVESGESSSEPRPRRRNTELQGALGSTSSLINIKTGDDLCQGLNLFIIDKVLLPPRGASGRRQLPNLESDNDVLPGAPAPSGSRLPSPTRSSDMPAYLARFIDNNDDRSTDGAAASAPAPSEPAAARMAFTGFGDVDMSSFASGTGPGMGSDGRSPPPAADIELPFGISNSVAPPPREDSGAGGAGLFGGGFSSGFGGGGMFGGGGGSDPGTSFPGGLSGGGPAYPTFIGGDMAGGGSAMALPGGASGGFPGFGALGDLGGLFPGFGGAGGGAAPAGGGGGLGGMFGIPTGMMGGGGGGFSGFP